jgi:phage terminase large subunit-like protein
MDIEGALWTYKQLDAARARGIEVDAVIATLAKIVVAIDPAVTNTEDSDETGIVVAGSTSRVECPLCGPVSDAHAFVLADYSGHYSPRGWAERALAAADEFEADEIIGEVNNGGDLVRETIDAAVERGKRAAVPYRDVRASRGKRTRAEPVAVLYGNVDGTAGPIRASRVHHIGGFPELEDQQTTWTADEKDSPDRMDALVWALTRLLIKGRGGHGSVAG